MNRDIINSIKATLYDRVSNPLYGTFVFVWLLANWKVVYITFFADKVFLESSTRLDYIISYFQKSSTFFGYDINPYFTHLLLAPLISSIIIILWLPKLLIELDKVTLNYKKKRREVKQKIENQRLLSSEESQKIVSENNRLKDSFNEAIEIYKEESLSWTCNKKVDD